MRRSIANALQHWQAEGLLSAAQVEELSSSISGVEKRHESARAVRVFGFIGAVLTGLGAILFVASNWEGMSPLERTLVLLAGYGLTVAAAVFAEKRELPMVAEAVWLISTLVLGANIFLIAQIHNMTLTLWQGTLAWTVGALAMGYARQSVAQIAVAVPLGLLTIGWAGGGSGWFFDDQVQFLFADGGLRPVLPLLGLALVAAAALLAARDDLKFAYNPHFRWGAFLAAASLIITTAHVDMATWFFNAEFDTRQVAIMVAAVALVGAAALFGRFESSMSRWALGGLAAWMLIMLIPIGDAVWLDQTIGDVHVYFGLYVAVVFATALFTIWLGMKARNTRLVNVGMASTTLIIIIQYFGWSFDLLDRSLAFVLGGIVLITLSVFMENRRRHIMEQLAA